MPDATFVLLKKRLKSGRRSKASIILSANGIFSFSRGFLQSDPAFFDKMEYCQFFSAEEGVVALVPIEKEAPESSKISPNASGSTVCISAKLQLLPEFLPLRGQKRLFERFSFRNIELESDNGGTTCAKALILRLEDSRLVDTRKAGPAEMANKAA